jgi:phosphohistidine phosphatase
MELILWRHADAEEGGQDRNRKLTAKGLRQAKRMAAWLEARLPQDAIIMASPARRAQQTAAALTDKFKTVDALAVGALAADVLKVAGWPDKHGTVVIVGHQPTLGQAAALAVTGKAADWSVKKGAAWWLASRDRETGARVYVRAVISADLV